MVDKLKKLEIKKLIKEYLFLLSDLEYKNLIIKESETNFSKEVYEKLGDKKIEIQLPKKEEEKETHHDEDVKKLYREIVKKTHPDKDSTGNLTEDYKQAVNAYESNNVLELYTIADRIGVECVINEKDIPKIKEELEKLKKKINRSETTYVYMWATNDNQKFKEYLIDQYLNALNSLNKKEGE